MKVFLQPPFRGLKVALWNWALKLRSGCLLVETMEEADVIALDDLSQIPKEYREDVDILILGEKGEQFALDNVLYLTSEARVIWYLNQVPPRKGRKQLQQGGHIQITTSP